MGQAVHFQAQGAGGSMFFARDRVVLSLPYIDPSLPSSTDTPENTDNLSFDEDSQYKQFVRIDLQFEGTRGAEQLQGAALQTSIVNIFKSEKKQEQQARIPTFRGLIYNNLYPGIDLYFEGQGSQLKSTYTVAPSADPSLISWTYGRNAETVINERGDLQVTIYPRGKGTAGSSITLIERAPVAWQELDGQHVPVIVHYEQRSGGSVGFAIEPYNVIQPLVGLIAAGAPPLIATLGAFAFGAAVAEGVGWARTQYGLP
jgi:hypothetical protein